MWCVCDEMLCLHHITATLGDLWRFDGVGNDPADPSAANFEGMPFVFMSGDRETDGVPDYCARPPCTKTTPPSWMATTLPTTGRLRLSTSAMYFTEEPSLMLSIL